LFIGTHIGLYNGKVIEIMADRVIVEEYETKKQKVNFKTAQKLK